MPTKTLTQLFVDNLKPAPTGTRVEYWDKVHQGFGVRVGDSGVKTFFVMPKLHGQRIRVKLGRHPVLTVKEARERAAREALACIDGTDPRRPAAPTALPFRAVAERFLHEYAAERQAESTRTETKRILNKEVLPHWDAMLAKGDIDGHGVWLRIMQAIHTLQHAKRLNDDAGHKPCVTSGAVARQRVDRTQGFDRHRPLPADTRGATNSVRLSASNRLAGRKVVFDVRWKCSTAIL